MKWLTTNYIREQARKSKRAATKVSWRHWDQIAGATEEEFWTGLFYDKVSICERYCGLCRRYNDRDEEGHRTCRRKGRLCPLGGDGCDHSKEYIDAANAYKNWMVGNAENYYAFHLAARAMADSLKKLMKK